jgi:hypothetical protein
MGPAAGDEAGPGRGGGRPRACFDGPSAASQCARNRAIVGRVRARTLRELITMDEANVLDRLLELLEAQRVVYCVIGGQAVNAYVDPLVSLDLDVVVAAGGLEPLIPLLEEQFVVRRHPHSVNLSAPGSELRVQFQTDPRYLSMPDRSTRRSVLGREMPVAAVEDVLAGKVWAAQDASRRPSKRQKDLADIARLLEAYPSLRAEVPAAVLERLVS